MQARIIAIIAGVLTLVIGLVLATLVLGTVTDAGSKTGAAVKPADLTPTGVGRTCAAVGAVRCTSSSGGPQTGNLTASDLVYFARIGSFSGARSVMNLLPLIYYTALVMLSIGMIGIGAGGFAGYGPMRNT